jgi:hypothetical protein
MAPGAVAIANPYTDLRRDESSANRVYCATPAKYLVQIIKQVVWG